MSHPERLQQRIDSYLMQLRRSLGDLPPGEVAEILQEIRGHILERAETSGELTEERLVTILKALGRPEDIAPLYQAESLVARARTSLSPVMLLRGALRWAMLSAWGFGLLLVGVFGYALGGSLILAGVGKIIAPHAVGAWLTPTGFQIGTASDPAAREVLGWWLIPVGLAGGPALVVATTRLLSWALRYARFRRPAAV
jgi:uncharacterized membrane protein